MDFFMGWVIYEGSMHSFLAAHSKQAKDVILGLVLKFSEIRS